MPLIPDCIKTPQQLAMNGNPRRIQPLAVQQDKTVQELKVSPSLKSTKDDKTISSNSLKRKGKISSFFTPKVNKKPKAAISNEIGGETVAQDIEENTKSKGQLAIISPEESFSNPQTPKNETITDLTQNIITPGPRKKSKLSQSSLVAGDSSLNIVSSDLMKTQLKMSTIPLTKGSHAKSDGFKNVEILQTPEIDPKQGVNSGNKHKTIPLMKGNERNSVGLKNVESSPALEIDRRKDAKPTKKSKVKRLSETEILALINQDTKFSAYSTQFASLAKTWKNCSRVTIPNWTLSKVSSCTLRDMHLGEIEISQEAELSLSKDLATVIQGLELEFEEVSKKILSENKLDSTILVRLQQKLALLAEKKYYGVQLNEGESLLKAIGEHKNCSFTRLEVCNVDLLDEDDKKRILSERKQLKTVSTQIRLLFRFLKNYINLKHIGTSTTAQDKKMNVGTETLKKKVTEDEMKILKFMREKELKKQKLIQKQKEVEERQKLKEKQLAEKEQKRLDKERKRAEKQEMEKLKLAERAKIAELKLAKKTPQRPKITLTKFFSSAKNIVKAPSNEITREKISEEQSLKQNMCDKFNDLQDVRFSFSSIVNTGVEMSTNNLLEDLVSRCKTKRIERTKRRRNRIKTDIQALTTSCRDEEQLRLCIAKVARKRLHQFSEDLRPAYFGSVEHLSDYQVGTCSTAKDVRKKLARNYLLKLEHTSKEALSPDYDYDSGLEWEEPDDGESIVSEIDKEKDEDELDYSDGWLAREEDEAGDKSMSGPCDGSTSVQKMKIIGVTYDDSLEKEMSRDLKRFSLQFFQDLDAKGSTKVMYNRVERVDEVDAALEILTAREKKFLQSCLPSRQPKVELSA